MSFGRFLVDALLIYLFTYFLFSLISRIESALGKKRKQKYKYPHRHE